MKTAKTKKTFDCLKFKRIVHARIETEYQGLSAEQKIAKFQEWGKTSGDELAKFWRGLKGPSADRNG